MVANKDFFNLINEKAKKFNIDPALAQAMVDKESSRNPMAVSPKGAQGLLQLMPATGKELGLKDPFDPDQNLEAGFKYLNQMKDRFGGDMKKALAAYNAGPGNVEKYGGVPPFKETQSYVKDLFSKLPQMGPRPETTPGIMPPPELSGSEEPEKESALKKIGRLFKVSTTPRGEDELGAKIPGIKEGVGSKVLSFALPILFGATGNPMMAAAAMGFLGQRKGQMKQAMGEQQAAQKERQALIKQQTPSSLEKEFRFRQDLSPEERLAFDEFLRTRNPESLARLLLSREELEFKKEKAEKELELKKKKAEAAAKGAKEKGLSGDAAKTFEIARGGLDNIGQLRQKIEEGANLLAPSIFDRQSSALIEDLADSLGRLRSGGAINADEEKRFKELVPSALDAYETKLFKLDQLQKKFQSIGESIAPSRIQELIGGTPSEEEKAQAREWLKKNPDSPFRGSVQEILGE